MSENSMYSTEISDLRARLLVRLQKVQDATTLHEIEQLLEENAENTARDDQYDQLIEEVLAEYTKTDEPLTYKSKLDNTGTIARFENLRVPLFFWNSIFSLLIFGLMISFQWEDGSLEMRWLTHLVYGLYLLTMGISAFEVFVLRILHRKHPSEPARKREWSYRLLAILLPPLRMGMRRLGNRDWLWLPRLGWAKANAALFTKLKKDFGTPMIVIALLIIPIFLIEWKLSDYMAENYPAFELEFWLGIAGAFIWIAFTLEFIIMIGVTNEKVDYCKRNWIDLFIIILPLLSFFPTLQILRVARLNQLVRVYRVRGLTMKIKEAFVLLAVFQRILYPNPTAQLQSLQKKLRNNRRQKEQLEEQVMYAVKRLRRKHEKKKS